MRPLFAFALAGVAAASVTAAAAEELSARGDIAKNASNLFTNTPLNSQPAESRLSVFHADMVKNAAGSDNNRGLSALTSHHALNERTTGAATFSTSSAEARGGFSAQEFRAATNWTEQALSAAPAPSAATPLILGVAGSTLAAGSLSGPALANPPLGAR